MSSASAVVSRLAEPAGEISFAPAAAGQFSVSPVAVAAVLLLAAVRFADLLRPPAKTCE